MTDILTRAREIVRNDPPCLYSPLGFRKVIAELADRLEKAEEALRRIRAATEDDWK